MRTISFCLIIACTLSLLTTLTQAKTFGANSDTLYYCKCICFTNSTIVPLYLPANPSKPCTSCTRQFCLDQKLLICKGAEAPDLDTDVGTGKEGDVEARCFQRDSPRDQMIVTLFVLTVICLLLTASIRNRLAQAIAERGRPTDLRAWGEALLTGPATFGRASNSPSNPGTRGGGGGGGLTMASISNGFVGGIPNFLRGGGSRGGGGSGGYGEVGR